MTLKTILDDCCFGTYDFVYLRIDFSTGQNVGYAFINFTDNDGMIALLDKWQGQPWTGWKSKDLDSSKCAQLSYATIQGSEALECRFRNSSVMQETPYVRPRKFLPYKDASDKNVVRLASTELSMPRPDNLAKLQRSMDSAQATGLFPPQGNSYGMQARCRVSTYDRGTPRDLMYGAGHHGGLTYEEKHNIEVWYAHMFGGGLGGLIPFEYIPASCITSYSSNFGGNNMSGPHGVVGGPVYGYQRNVMATPSRRSYKAPSSARYSGGYDCSNPFN